MTPRAGTLDRAETADSLIPAWQGGVLVPVDKLEVHRRGLRHPAVSVFVIGPQGILIQQRALGKYHSGGLWANTCCTHPHWGEAAADCAVRRLGQELGLSGLTLQHKGQVEYRADVGGGMTEHELVDVYVARVARTPELLPDPAEVAATAWRTVDALVQDLTADPARFTAWLKIYLSDHAARILAQERGA